LHRVPLLGFIQARNILLRPLHDFAVKSRIIVRN